jgi:hypothetical protein
VPVRSRRIKRIRPYPARIALPFGLISTRTSRFPGDRTVSGLISYHGGTPVDRVVTGPRAAELAKEAASLTSIKLTPKQSCDLELIGIGGYAPHGLHGQGRL